MVRNHVLGSIGPLDPELLTINTTWTPTNAPGNAVQVDLVYDFAPIAPIMPIEMLALNASSTMIISY